MTTSLAGDQRRALLLSHLRELRDGLEKIDEQIAGAPSFIPTATTGRPNVQLSRQKVAELLDQLISTAQRARAVANEWATEMQGADPSRSALETVTDLPRRIITILRKNGMASVADVRFAADDDLLAIPNIGLKSLRILRSYIPRVPRDRGA